MYARGGEGGQLNEAAPGRVHGRRICILYLSRERRRKKAGENTTVYKIAVILSTGEGTRACFYDGESVSGSESLGARRASANVLRRCFGSDSVREKEREWLETALCAALTRGLD